jgi:hypothetical protein
MDFGESLQVRSDSTTLARRRFLHGAAAAVILGPFILRRRYQVFAQSSAQYPERVVRLVRESLVIDMLNQFLYRTDKRSVLDDWLTRPRGIHTTGLRAFQELGSQCDQLR